MKPSIKPRLKSAATKTSDRMETGNPMVEFPMGRMLGGAGGVASSKSILMFTRKTRSLAASLYGS